MLIASFILCFCFISSLSSNRYFDDPTKKKDDKKFKAFVIEYFDFKYHSQFEKLYYDLRSKLIHNYSLNRKGALGDEIKDLHLRENNGKLYLDIDVFIQDTEGAFNKYLSQLKSDEVLQPIALKHHQKWNVIGVKSID